MANLRRLAGADEQLNGWSLILADVKAALAVIEH